MKGNIMPPKVKITKTDIINASLFLARKGGADALNARSISAVLGCSTQPIFSNFKSMEELDEAVISSAYEHYLSFIDEEIGSKKYPEYKSMGMAYIRFAREESELFKLLFMRDRTGCDLSPTPDYNRSTSILTEALGISPSQAERMHFELWVFVHGIATMLATSFLDLSEEDISDVLSDVYASVRQKFTEDNRK